MKVLALALMVAVAAPVAAQNAGAAQPAAPAAPEAKAKDPNRVICEREEEIGSRLGGKKVCKTAAQWQDERNQQRQTLEGVQRQATSTGMPSGTI